MGLSWAGRQLKVLLCTARATSLLRKRTAPQLRSLSDFQGPTSAPSSSTKSRVCTQELGGQEECAGSALAGAFFGRSGYFLLRKRTAPQLRILSDFQGPTSAPSSSTNAVCPQKCGYG